MKQNMGQKEWNKVENGQSLIEFAASLVLLLIILAGIVDLGRAIIFNFVLENAAQEGIVYGTSFPTDCNQIAFRIADNIEHTLVTSMVKAEVSIENNKVSGGYSACGDIDASDVYATKIMKIKLSTNMKISMPFLALFIGQPCDDPSLGNQCIPLSITTTGVILRPPPPTST
jgi:hypothetical protein